MFKSRKGTQEEQKQIVWEDGAAFLLSLSNEEGKAAELLEEICEDTAVIRVRGKMEDKKPYFSAQAYFDHKQGISYQITFPGKSRFTAIYQHKNWWVRPAFVTEAGQIPERTQLLLTKLKGTYFAFLSVCGKECRTDMQGGSLSGNCSGDSITVSVGSNGANRKKIEDISLVIAGGSDPYLCVEKAVKKALELMGKPAMFRENRTYPEMFDGFGWCSWDAFYHKVTHEGVRQKMEEFRDKKLPVKWVLIDDGWLDADYDRQVLRDLDAASEAFPKGLGGCVRELKEEFGIEKVGVWHAVMGYWDGLIENSPAAEKLKAGTRTLPDGRILPAPEAGKAFMFYDTWHDYLKNQCDIDFVKVDGQSAISLAYGGLETYGHASGEIQKGLNASAALHFNNQIINCMGMASEDVWNRPSSAISRSSDDFVPEVEHGFREHAIQNSYNSIWQGQFFWGDWDMFWSSHVENLQNSILRAVSGGPVYVSDKVGETDPEYILPLITEEGKLLRCEGVGLPTLDCLFENPVDTLLPLKIFNRYGKGYLVAALNICAEDRECSGRLSKTDFLQLGEGNFYVYSWKKKELTLLREEGMPFTLEKNGGELFLLLPADEKPAIIGILEKYIPWACVRTIRKEENHILLEALEKGTLGVAAKTQPKKILVNGTETAPRIVPDDGTGTKAPIGEEALITVEVEESGALVELYW